MSLSKQPGRQPRRGAIADDAEFLLARVRVRRCLEPEMVLRGLLLLPRGRAIASALPQFFVAHVAERSPGDPFAGFGAGLEDQANCARLAIAMVSRGTPSRSSRRGSRTTVVMRGRPRP